MKKIPVFSIRLLQKIGLHAQFERPHVHVETMLIQCKIDGE
jgi:hypothetical protein